MNYMNGESNTKILPSIISQLKFISVICGDEHTFAIQGIYFNVILFLII